MSVPPEQIPEDLRRLAAAHGVATSYRNERREPVEVDADVVIRVLGLLDVDAGTEPAGAARTWPAGRSERAGLLAPTVAVRRRTSPAAARGRLLVAEDGTGSTCATRCPASWRPAGTGCTPATARRPPWSRPRRRCRRRRPPGAGCCSCTRCARPAPGASATWATCASSSTGPPRARRRRGAAQPAARARTHAPGAALALHAVQPAVRQPAGAAHRGPRRLPAGRPGHPRGGGRAAGLADHRANRLRPGVGGQAVGAGVAVARRGPAPTRSTSRSAPTGLRDWATYCALAERHGGRWTRWPEPLRDVAGPAVAAARRSWRRGWRSTPGSSSVAPSSWARCGHRAGRGHGAGRVARPRGGGRRGRRRRLGAGRRARHRGERRGAAGQLHPARAGLGAAAVAAGPPGRAPAMPRCATCCAPCSPTPTACGSTTSPGCGACGGSRRATARTGAPTCTTTPT